METNIKARIFEIMMERFEAFAQKIHLVCNQSGNKEIKEWLNRLDVCMKQEIRK